MSYYEKVKIRVIPGGGRNEIIGKISGRIKIRINAKPEKGKANDELIEFLSDILNKPKSYITIEYGQNTRDKTVKILCFDDDELKPLTG